MTTVTAFNISHVATPFGDEFRIYPDTIYQGFSISQRVSAKKENTLENRERSNIRANRKIRELIQLNFFAGFAFMTLTFKENVTDITVGNAAYSNFIKRLRYYLSTRVGADFEFKYVCSVEFQKRGALHYHVVCNLPTHIVFSDVISLWWKSIAAQKDIETKTGSVVIKFSDDMTIAQDMQKVINYISKYMSKYEIDSRLCGKKTYFSSKNLTLPVREKYHVKQEILTEMCQDDSILAYLENNFCPSREGGQIRRSTYQDGYTGEDILYIEFLRPIN